MIVTLPWGVVWFNIQAASIVSVIVGFVCSPFDLSTMSRDTAKMRLARQTMDDDRARSRSRSRSCARPPRSSTTGTAQSRLRQALCPGKDFPRPTELVTDEQRIAAEGAFRRNITAIYLRNKLSAKDTAELIRDADVSGARQLSDLAKAGGGGKHPKNYQRDLTRNMVKGCLMPEPYFAEITVIDRNTNKSTTAWLPFLLVL